VVRKHALPNALIPVVTVAALMMIGLLNGVVITETVFNYPGWFFPGPSRPDTGRRLCPGHHPVSSFILVFGNLVADVLYE